jgi:phosphoribosylformylglycinamidine synthase
VVARIDDVRKAVTMDAKGPGDLVYVLGMTYEEMGGSEYLASRGLRGGTVPAVNAVEAIERYVKLSEAIKAGLVASCHDCSDGGLAVALAETAFSGGLGMEVELDRVPAEGVGRTDFLLFSESQSRFVVTVRPERAADFERAMAGTVFGRAGVVLEGPELRLVRDGNLLFSRSIEQLKAAWKAPLAW